MDFTKVYNSHTNNYCSTPPIVYEAGAEYFPDISLSSGCIVSEGIDPLGFPKPQYEVGLDHTFEPMNEPPMISGNFSYLLNMMDAFKQGNYNKAGVYVQKLFDTEPKAVATRYSTNRSLVARAETNAERCFFSKYDLERLASDNGLSSVCFINPNKGTIARFSEYNRSVDVVLTDCDADYVHSVSLIMLEKGWGKPRIVKKVDDLPKDVLYYSSFNGGCEYLEKLQYVAFTPDLVSMKLAGVPVTYADVNGEYFEFMRGSEKVTALSDCAEYQYPADVVMTDFKGCDQYKSPQGILHSLSSTVRLQLRSAVVQAPPYPLCLEYSLTKKTFTRADQVEGPWERVVSGCPIPGKYVRSKFYGNVYDLGDFITCEETVKDLHEFVHEGKYYRSSPHGHHIIREKANGDVYFNLRRWVFCDGIFVVNNINELMQLRLSGMRIYHYRTEYVDRSVSIPLTDIGEVQGMTSLEMRELIKGYNMAKLKT